MLLNYFPEFCTQVETTYLALNLRDTYTYVHDDHASSNLLSTLQVLNPQDCGSPEQPSKSHLSMLDHMIFKGNCITGILYFRLITQLMTSVTKLTLLSHGPITRTSCFWLIEIGPIANHSAMHTFWPFTMQTLFMLDLNPRTTKHEDWTFSGHAGLSCWTNHQAGSIALLTKQYLYQRPRQIHIVLLTLLIYLDAATSFHCLQIENYILMVSHYLTMCVTLMIGNYYINQLVSFTTGI